MVDTLICRTLQVHLIVCALRFKMPGSVPGLVPGRNGTLTAMAIFTGTVGMLSAGGVRVTVRSCFFFFFARQRWAECTPSWPLRWCSLAGCFVW